MSEFMSPRGECLTKDFFASENIERVPTQPIYKTSWGTKEEMWNVGDMKGVVIRYDDKRIFSFSVWGMPTPAAYIDLATAVERGGARLFQSRTRIRGIKR